MAVKVETQLNWVEADPDTLPTKARNAYTKYQEARRHAAELRDAFEELTVKHMKTRNMIPKGHGVVFGYRFGKLSYALKPDDEKPQRKSKKELASF